MASVVPHIHSGAAPGRDTALREYLEPLKSFFDDKAITEICINRPGEVFTESSYGWERHEIPQLTLAWCRKLVQLIATFSIDKINEETPLLSGSLPDGERVQVVMPPACELGTISITIRKPSLIVMTPEQYETSGFHGEVPDYPAVRFPKEDKNAFYKYFQPPRLKLPRNPRQPNRRFGRIERALLRLLEQRRYWDFYSLAIREHKNIVLSGATGSGKTTFGRALVNFIPSHERLLTIEDTREMFIENQPNRVHLLYSALGQGTSNVTGKSLLQACLRMDPARVLLSELRSAVAYDFIVNTFSGHPGSITTLHAGSANGAFEMLALRVKESDEGKSLSREDILGLLRAEVDIVIQVKQMYRPSSEGKMKKVRRVTEIYYDPEARRKPLG